MKKCKFKIANSTVLFLRCRWCTKKEVPDCRATLGPIQYHNVSPRTDYASCVQCSDNLSALHTPAWKDKTMAVHAALAKR